MNKTVLFALWGGMFSICAGLGFIPEPSGILRWGLTAAALLCFLPPALLLYQASRCQDLPAVKLVRDLSALSLGLTLVCLILNFLVVFRSETLGQMVHAVLVIVSSPMICSGHWALSLFLWACLLMAGRKLSKSEKLP